MRMVWTAWTMRGGRTSLSFPTLQADENKLLSFCYFTVILEYYWKWFPDSTTGPRSDRKQGHLPTSQTGPGSSPLATFHPHENTDVITLWFLFLHEIVSQSKVSCCCCYCLTIIATLRSNFTIFGSHEPTMFICAPVVTFDLLVFVFP